MMMLATLIGAICMTAGLLLSYELSDTFSLSAPTGPLIILLAAAGYGVSSVMQRLTGQKQ